MKKLLLHTAACALLLAGAASCQSDDLVNYDNMTPEQIAQEVEKRFDFNTFKTLPLKLKVAPLTTVKLYELDPSQNPEAEPFFQALADINGEFEMNKTFPVHLIDHPVWVETSNGVTKATLTKNGLNVTSMSRALTISGLDGADGLCKALAEITYYTLKPGRDNTDILEHQMTRIDILPTTDDGAEVMIAAIDYGDQFYGRLYYYYYDASKSLTDQYTYKEFVERFLTDKYRLLPVENRSSVDYTNRTDWINETWNGDDFIGKSTQLKYYGPAGDETGVDKFPKGTSIGFIHMTEDVGCYGENPQGSQFIKLTSGGAYKIKDINDATYNPADKTWEEAKCGIPQSAAAMDIYNVLKSGTNIKDPDSTVPTTITVPDALKAENVNNWVYTYEDNTGGGDKDMDDLKFLAVIKGKVRHSVPDVIIAKGSFKGYYCFEDLYPNEAGGDYDLNDVVVSYDYQYDLGTVHSNTGSSTTGVTTFRYCITPIHDGATFINDFHLAYSGPKESLATSGHKEVYTNHTQACADKTFFQGTAFAAFNVESGFFDGRNADDDPFAAAVLFAPENKIIGPEQETVSDIVTNIVGIDPYIYCQNTGKEVHLTKFSYGGPNYGAGGSLLDHYLTTNKAGESYEFCPFAINIPECDGSKFTPTPESVPIYKAFPKFVQWVASKGEEATDWYKDTPLDIE